MEFPPPKRFKKVYIEISNVCNLHCGFCPEVEREKNLMSREVFERVVADAAPLSEEACFHLMGEPLSHPRFADFVDVCAARALPVNITTNGTLLDDKRIDALLKPIVRQVNFSLHSFESNFPGQDMGPYLKKIFDFTRRAFERRPDLYVNYRLWNLEAGENANAEILEKAGRAFGVELDGRVDVRWRKGRHVINRLYLHFDTRFEWPSPHAPVRSSVGTCRALSSHLGILSDGTVVPCCLDKEGVIALGDARRQTLGEILAGERARAMALGFQEGRLVEDLCRRCTFIARFTSRSNTAPAGSRGWARGRTR